MSFPAVPAHDSPVGAAWDRAACLALVAAAVYCVALLLTTPPDPRGHGTHEALGMPACGWPDGLGIPCPTCGYTTAAVHLLRFSPLRALHAQPAGAVLAACGLAAAAVALVDLLRGRAFVARLYTLRWGTLSVAALGVFLAGWCYKLVVFER
jgi:hypothetical protein